MLLPTQVFISTEKPEKDKLQPIKNDYFWKPRAGGLWTSSLVDDRSDWMVWLEEQGYTLDMERWGGDVWLLEPADANVFVVSSPDEYMELATNYPLSLPFSLKASRLRILDNLVDWEAVSRDFEAIHVPDPRAFRFGLNSSAAMFFDTCDAESTCWFKWCFQGEPKVMVRA